MTPFVWADSRRRPFALMALLGVAVLLGACSSADERKAAHLQRGNAHLEADEFEKARVEFKNVLKIDPHDAQARVALGRALERLAHWRLAAGHYLRVIEDHPENVPARMRMGRIYLLAKQPAKAIELAEAALQAEPDNATALALRGSARAASGDLAGAKSDADAAIAAEPGNLEAVAFAATMAGRAKDYDAAQAILMSGLEANPQADSLRVLRAEFYARANQADNAAAALRDLLEGAPDDFGHRRRLWAYLVRVGKVDQGEQVLREGIARQPDASAGHLALAEHLAKHRDWRDAKTYLEKAIEERGEPAVYQRALAKLYRAAGAKDDLQALYRTMIAQHELTEPGLEARSQLAAMLAAQRKFEDAGKLVEEVLAENTSDREALGLRAKLALAQQDPLGAIADLRSVLRDSPSDAQSLWLLGRAHLLNKEPELAKDQFQRAVDVNPTLTRPRLELAQLHLRKKDTPKALEVLQEGLEVTPGDLSLLLALARLQVSTQDLGGAAATARSLKSGHPERAMGYYLAGLVAQSQGDFAGAAEQFEQAAERAPENASALGSMVASLIADKRADEALESIGAAAERHPENAAILRLQGRVLRGLQRFDEAKTVFDRVIALQPKAPVSYRELALTHLAVGEPNMALSVLRSGYDATDGSLLITTDLAQLRTAMGQVDEAVELYDRYLKKRPDSEPASNNLAMVLATHRTDPESLNRAAKLAERFRDSKVAGYLDTLGWVHLKRGETSAAVSVLEEVVSMAPDVPTFEYHLAAAEIAAGRANDGRERLQKVLASKRTFAERRDAEALMASLQ